MIDLKSLTPDILNENFSFLESWEDKYRYLIELGEALPPFDINMRTSQNRVDGCMSQVWMMHKKSTENRHLFFMDSDAHIVRGLQAILWIHINNKTTQEIMACDLNSIFDRLDLGSHISGTRRNGFAAMIERIKKEILL